MRMTVGTRHSAQWPRFARASLLLPLLPLLPNFTSGHRLPMQFQCRSSAVETRSLLGLRLLLFYCWIWRLASSTLFNRTLLHNSTLNTLSLSLSACLFILLHGVQQHLFWLTFWSVFFFEFDHTNWPNISNFANYFITQPNAFLLHFNQTDLTCSSGGGYGHSAQVQDHTWHMSFRWHAYLFQGTSI